MAIIEKIVERIPVTTYDEQEYTVIKLDKKEVATLMDVLASVAGCPKTSMRKYVDDIYIPLRKLHPNIPTRHDTMAAGGSQLYYKDGTIDSV